MSRHSGHLVRTADGWTEGKTARQVRCAEAQDRAAATLYERTARFRRDRAVVQAALREVQDQVAADSAADSAAAVVLDRRRRRRLSGKDDVS